MYCFLFFLLALLVFALYTWMLRFWCINIYNCYSFLKDWPLYHYMMTFVSFYILIWGLFCLIYIYIYLSIYWLLGFFLFVCFFIISLKYLYHPFNLSLCVSLRLKWVSCRQHFHWVLFLNTVSVFCVLQLQNLT